MTIAQSNVSSGMCGRAREVADDRRLRVSLRRHEDVDLLDAASEPRRVVRRRDLEHAAADVGRVRADEALDVDAVDRRAALEAPVGVDRRRPAQVTEIRRAAPAPVDDAPAGAGPKPAADARGNESSPAGQGRDHRAVVQPGTRIVVVSPHLDDGVLSLGASMASLGARRSARRAADRLRLRSRLGRPDGRVGRRGGFRDRGRGGTRAPRGGPSCLRAPRRDAASGSRSEAWTTSVTATRRRVRRRCVERSTAPAACSSRARRSRHPDHAWLRAARSEQRRARRSGSGATPSSRTRAAASRRPARSRA